MDFSKLSANEKLAIYGATAVVVLGLVSQWGETFTIAILAAIALLVVVLLPSFAPNVSLPGSKGSLMLALSGIAAVFGVLEVLRWITYIFGDLFRAGTIFFLIAVVGAVVAAWASWQIFQAEGGKFQIGMTGSTGSVAAPSSSEPMAAPPVAPAPPPVAPAPPPVAPAPPPAAPAPPPAEPMAQAPAEPMAGDADEPEATPEDETRP